MNSEINNNLNTRNKYNNIQRALTDKNHLDLFYYTFFHLLFCSKRQNTLTELYYKESKEYLSLIKARLLQTFFGFKRRVPNRSKPVHGQCANVQRGVENKMAA